MGPSLQIVFDANDVRRLVGFWEQALGYQVQPPPPEFETWEDFARDKGIPEEEQWDGSRQREALERGEFWIVMQDPEGNEFCLQ
jgi:Glyoxalase-like domain